MMRSSHRRESSEGTSILTMSSMLSLTAGEISSCGHGNFPAATHRCPPSPTREGAAIGFTTHPCRIAYLIMCWPCLSSAKKKKS